MAGYRERWRKVRANTAHTEPLFLAAIEASGHRSIVVPEKLQNLFWIIKEEFPTLASQNVVEFGSYRGGSALFMGYLLKELHPGARLYALDTFEGLPPTTDHDEHFQGDFSDADLDGFRSRIERNNLPITIIPGLCQATFPQLAEQRFGIAHIDVDIYEAVAWASNAAWDQLTPGGYLAFDDVDAPRCLGATRALEEFSWSRRIHAEQAWPHWVYRK